MVSIVSATLAGVEALTKRLIKNNPFYGNEVFDKISNKN